MSNYRWQQEHEEQQQFEELLKGNGNGIHESKEEEIKTETGTDWPVRVRKDVGSIADCQRLGREDSLH